MRKPLFLLVALLLVLFSCDSHSRKGKDEATFAEFFPDTTEKATAIFWVDKKAIPPNYPLKRVRTAKAKVIIRQNGKVDLLEFRKQQPSDVAKYIAYRLEIFRVPSIMLDSGYVKTGEQYVQLRYCPDYKQMTK